MACLKARDTDSVNNAVPGIGAMSGHLTYENKHLLGF